MGSIHQQRRYLHQINDRDLEIAFANIRKRLNSASSDASAGAIRRKLPITIRQKHKRSDEFDEMQIH